MRIRVRVAATRARNRKQSWKVKLRHVKNSFSIGNRKMPDFTTFIKLPDFFWTVQMKLNSNSFLKQ